MRGILYDTIRSDSMFVGHEKKKCIILKLMVCLYLEGSLCVDVPSALADSLARVFTLQIQTVQNVQISICQSFSHPDGKLLDIVQRKRAHYEEYNSAHSHGNDFICMAHYTRHIVKQERNKTKKSSGRKELNNNTS